jgi:hypothetical protein
MAGLWHFRPFLPYPPGKNGRAMTLSTFFAIPWKSNQGMVKRFFISTLENDMNPKS